MFLFVVEELETDHVLLLVDDDFFKGLIRMAPLRLFPLYSGRPFVSIELSNAIESPFHGDHHKASLPRPETILFENKSMELITVFCVLANIEVLLEEALPVGRNLLLDNMHG